MALAGISIWAAARAERAFLFGLILGGACTVRPFFAISAVVATGWSWRQAMLAFVGACVGGFIPFAIVPIWPWEWYRFASDAGEYVSGCGSIPGVFGFSPLGGIIAYLGSAAILGHLRWTRCGTDRTMALSATVAMLVYPLAWFQYDVSLIATIAWLAVQSPKDGNRLILYGLTGFLLLRSLPDVQGAAELPRLAAAQTVLQVAGRFLLLVTVIAVGGGASAKDRAPS